MRKIDKNHVSILAIEYIFFKTVQLTGSGAHFSSNKAQFLITPFLIGPKQPICRYKSPGNHFTIPIRRSPNYRFMALKTGRMNSKYKIYKKVKTGDGARMFINKADIRKNPLTIYKSKS